MTLKKIEESIKFIDKGFTKRILFEDEQVLGIAVAVKAGQEMFAHRHENSALAFTILRGKGEATVNGEVIKIEKGSTGMVKGADKIGFQNVEEDLVAFITLSPKPNNPVFSKEIGYE